MNHTRPAKAIAFLGTGSDVGKSIVVTAIGRIFKNRGYSVAPYKAQNMSNNSYVTLEGGEMGRAQVVQAEACGVEPHTDMNPVLLKPNTDIGAQVVLQGKAIGHALAADYFKDTSKIREPAFQSLEKLKAAHDLIVIEGAGSCGEVNLRSRDFVNFETAHVADAPVILVADIDRGGVFAQLIGTLQVIPEADRKRVAGFIINKFRGDPSLFDDGIEYLESQTGLPVLGLIPYYRHIEIDPEDGLPLETVVDPPNVPRVGKINIACIRLPHISNFTDFNPLIRNPAVCFHYLSKPRNLEDYDALILPGTKNVRFDLQWLKNEGWGKRIHEFEGHLLGICGGFQMLGRVIQDPHGVESEPGDTAGFGLLDIETVLEKEKVLFRSQGELADGTRIDGYEIHMGRTTLGPNATPMINVKTRTGEPVADSDGAVSNDWKIAGSYFHGLFDFPDFRNRFLQSLNPDYEVEDALAAADFKQSQYNLLAEHFEKYLDMDRLCSIIQGEHGGTGSIPSAVRTESGKVELAPPEKGGIGWDFVSLRITRADSDGGTGSTPSSVQTESGKEELAPPEKGGIGWDFVSLRVTRADSEGKSGSSPTEDEVELVPPEHPERKHPAHFPPFERVNSTIIFLTVCSKGRKAIFDNEQMHQLLLSAWNEADSWLVGKYMIMPDHIHLFCSPNNRDASLKSWVSFWKSLVSRAHLSHGKLENGRGDAKRAEGPTRPSTSPSDAKRDEVPASPSKAELFQRDYWDTQLRRGEHYSEKWACVEQNPVRAELVERPADWIFQGELNKLLWLSD